MMRQGSGGYVQNFKSTCQKIKIFIFGVGGGGVGGQGIGLRSISNLD